MILLISASQVAKITLSALFVLVIFEVGSHFMPGLAWTMILLFMLPHVARMTAHTTTLSHCFRWGGGGVSRKFCLGWPWNIALQISAWSDVPIQLWFNQLLQEWNRINMVQSMATQGLLL
jgi:hypothetical protein